MNDRLINHPRKFAILLVGVVLGGYGAIVESTTLLFIGILSVTFATVQFDQYWANNSRAD